MHTAAYTAATIVLQSGGPDYKVPLGRRDGLTFATQNATKEALPSPTSNVTQLLPVLALITLNSSDLVALSGGHTIGISHCASFSNRIFPSRDSTMDQTLFKNLRQTCPSTNSTNTTNIDLRTPTTFDNKYYVDLVNRQGLFTSDEDLYMDSRTKEMVLEFALNETFFFEQFAASMVKMGQLGVLTGANGEIRTNCSAINGGKISMWGVEEEVENAMF